MNKIIENISYLYGKDDENLDLALRLLRKINLGDDIKLNVKNEVNNTIIFKLNINYFLGKEDLVDQFALSLQKRIDEHPIKNIILGRIIDSIVIDKEYATIVSNINLY